MPYDARVSARFAVLLVLAPCAACGEADAVARDGRPNLLIVSLDSVRRDALGAYGARYDGRSPTPHLDRLAAEGVRVEDAHSTTSWTLPAHVTLFTGVPELVHGVEQDGQAIGAATTTLAERLREQGYHTAGVYSGPYLDGRFGFARGFEHWRAGYGPELAAAAAASARALERVHGLADSEPRERRYAELERSAEAEGALERASHRDSSSRSVTELALEELAAVADDSRPFFLFAHYFDAHYDYVPPPPHDALDPGYAGTIDGRDFARRLGAPPPAPRDLAHLRALQAGELEWIDAEVGRLLAELERRGLSENTLVVVVSDHGEEFGEHGGLGHRRTLFEEAVRVPMLFRFPGRLASGVHAGPLSLAAVTPAVLGLLAGARDLPAPESSALARLVLSPTGKREDARVLEAFRAGSIKILREQGLQAGRATLRWTDLAQHPEERDSDWSSDFGDAHARTALDLYRSEYARLAEARRAPARTAKTDDLLAAFRGLGYAGEEARVGAIAAEELVLPPPAPAEPR